MKNIVKKSSSKESKIVYWMPPPFTEASKTSTVTDMRNYIKAWLSLSRQDSPANRSALRENKKAHKTKEICGLGQSLPFAWYDPDTHSLRTSQASLLQDICPEFSQTWPKQGMMRDGRCWVQTMWEQGTGERGCGYWPTPSTMDHIDRKGMRPSRAVTNRKTGYLSEMIWPTPNASIDTGKPLPQRKPNPSGGQKPPLVNKIGGQLNPDWVEWLMGWPIGWSSLEPITELIWLDWSVDPADMLPHDYSLPTPCCSDQGRSHAGDWSATGKNLHNYVLGKGKQDPNWEAKKAERTWPTPRCNKTTDEKYETWKKRQEKGGVSTPPLTLAVKMEKWRTPSQNEPGINPERLKPIEGGELGGMNRHFDKETGRMAQLGVTQQAQLRGGGQGIIPRVAIGIKDRVNRLKAIGNGQVSKVAATAWRILS